MAGDTGSAAYGHRIADPRHDRWAHLLRRLVDAPVTLVTRVDATGARFPGASGLPEPVHTTRTVPLTHSFCKYVVAYSQPLIVRDVREDPRLRTNAAIADFGVLAYAGWPLTDHTGAVVGTLCALDVVPHSWTDADREALELLGAGISAGLALAALRAQAETA